MNMNSIVTMITRMVMRRLIGKGVNAGLDMATQRLSGRQGGDTDSKAAGRKAAEGKDIARRARQAAKLTRRMGRF